MRELAFLRRGDWCREGGRKKLAKFWISTWALYHELSYPFAGN